MSRYVLVLIACSLFSAAGNAECASRFAYYPGDGTELHIIDDEGDVIETIQLPSRVVGLDAVGNDIFATTEAGQLIRIAESGSMYTLSSAQFLGFSDSLAASPDGFGFVHNAGGRATWLYDNAGQLLGSAGNSVFASAGFDFSPDGALFSLQRDRQNSSNGQVWRVASTFSEFSNTIGSNDTADIEVVVDGLGVLDQFTASLSISVDGRIGVSRGDDPTVFLFDINGSLLSDYALPGIVSALDFGPDGELYAVVDGDEGGFFRLIIGDVPARLTAATLYRSELSSGFLDKELVALGVPEPGGVLCICSAAIVAICGRRRHASQ